MDENWRNGLDNIKIAKNVLSKKDLHELKTYMYTNMAFHEIYPNERIPRTDGKDFPIYNFLPTAFRMLFYIFRRRHLEC